MQEVKSTEHSQTITRKSGRCRLTGGRLDGGPICNDLNGKILVFWVVGRLWGEVTYKGLSSILFLL